MPLLSLLTEEQDCCSSLTISCSSVNTPFINGVLLPISIFSASGHEILARVGGTCFRIAVVSLDSKEGTFQQGVIYWAHWKIFLMLLQGSYISILMPTILTSWKGEEMKLIPEKRGSFFFLLCACSVKPLSSAAMLSQEWNKWSFLLTVIIKSFAVFCRSFLG